MSASADFEDEVIELARRYIDRPGRDIHLEDRLLEDLGLDGHDADEFITAYKEQFSVDMTRFVWQRFFGDEALNLLAPLVTTIALLHPLIRRRWRSAKAAERSISLQHLVEVARRGVWFDPGEEKHRAPRALWQIALVIMTIPASVMIVTLPLLFLAYDAFSLPTLGAWAFAVIMVWSAWRNLRSKLASAPD